MTGLNLKESITVQCNADDKVHTFTNQIRRISGVVVESIDFHNPDRSKCLEFLFTCYHKIYSSIKEVYDDEVNDVKSTLDHKKLNFEISLVLNNPTRQ